MKTDACLPTPETVMQRNVETAFDAAGRLLYARCIEKTLMDRCVELGYLDHHHAEYAMTFLGLRLAWLAPVAYKASSLCREVESYFDELPTRPSEVYDAICSQLEPGSGAVVVYAATFLLETPKAAVEAITGDVCFKAFEEMVRAMDMARDGMKKALA